MSDPATETFARRGAWHQAAVGTAAAAGAFALVVCAVVVFHVARKDQFVRKGHSDLVGTRQLLALCSSSAGSLATSR